MRRCWCCCCCVDHSQDTDTKVSEINESSHLCGTRTVFPIHFRNFEHFCKMSVPRGSIYLNKTISLFLETSFTSEIECLLLVWHRATRPQRRPRRCSASTSLVLRPLGGTRTHRSAPFHLASAPSDPQNRRPTMSIERVANGGVTFPSMPSRKFRYYVLIIGGKLRIWLEDIAGKGKWYDARTLLRLATSVAALVAYACCECYMLEQAVGAADGRRVRESRVRDSVRYTTELRQSTYYCVNDDGSDSQTCQTY